MDGRKISIKHKRQLNGLSIGSSSRQKKNLEIYLWVKTCFAVYSPVLIPTAVAQNLKDFEKMLKFLSKISPQMLIRRIFMTSHGYIPIIALAMELLEKDLPMRGTDSEVSGIFSAMANMKTEKAKRTVIPKAIFSPDSGGRQKTSSVSTDIIMHLTK